MVRYIDTDVLKEKMLKYGFRSADQTITEFVEDILPAADVVEAVRCKDCKYYLHSNEKCELIDTRLHFYETDSTWTEDAFCAWGERKEQ